MCLHTSFAKHGAVLSLWQDSVTDKKRARVNLTQARKLEHFTIFWCRHFRRQFSFLLLTYRNEELGMPLVV